MVEAFPLKSPYLPFNEVRFLFSFLCCTGTNSGQNTKYIMRECNGSVIDRIRRLPAGAVALLVLQTVSREGEGQSPLFLGLFAEMSFIQK